MNASPIALVTKTTTSVTPGNTFGIGKSAIPLFPETYFKKFIIQLPEKNFGAPVDVIRLEVGKTVLTNGVSQETE
jgi:hypothetical protein